MITVWVLFDWYALDTKYPVIENQHFLFNRTRIEIMRALYFHSTDKKRLLNDICLLNQSDNQLFQFTYIIGNVMTFVVSWTRQGWFPYYNTIFQSHLLCHGRLIVQLIYNAIKYFSGICHLMDTLRNRLFVHRVCKPATTRPNLDPRGGMVFLDGSHLEPVSIRPTEQMLSREVGVL